MPSHSQSRTFNAPIEQVREAAHDALSSLGSEVEVVVESSQRVRIALLDLGSRNRRNVGTVLTAMASRLGT